MSSLLQFAENVKFPWSWFLRDRTQVLKEKKIPCRLFTSSIKGEIRHFHAVVVQWRQKNVKNVYCTCKVVVLLIKPKFFDILAAVAVVVAKAPFKEASAKENWLPTKLCTTYESQEVRRPCCRLMDIKCKCVNVNVNTHIIRSVSAHLRPFQG